MIYSILFDQWDDSKKNNLPRMLDTKSCLRHHFNCKGYVRVRAILKHYFFYPDCHLLHKSFKYCDFLFYCSCFANWWQLPNLHTFCSLMARYTCTHTVLQFCTNGREENCNIYVLWFLEVKYTFDLVLLSFVKISSI